MPHQSCPLCSSAAIRQAVKLPRSGKVFDCPTCGHYLIDMESERYLAELPEFAYTEHRLKLSQYAQSIEKSSMLAIHAPMHGDPRSSSLETQTTMVVTTIYPAPSPD